MAKRERGLTYLLERIPKRLWKPAQRKALAEGHTMRWLFIKWLADYVSPNGDKS